MFCVDNTEDQDRRDHGANRKDESHYGPLAEAQWWQQRLASETKPDPQFVVMVNDEEDEHRNKEKDNSRADQHNAAKMMRTTTATPIKLGTSAVISSLKSNSATCHGLL